MFIFLNIPFFLLFMLRTDIIIKIKLHNTYIKACLQYVNKTNNSYILRIYLYSKVQYITLPQLDTSPNIHHMSVEMTKQKIGMVK